MGVFKDDPLKADIILFNSHHNIDKVLQLKFKYPEKVFIHRIDGPVSFLRKKNRLTDKLIFDLNKTMADGTIFQSEWSKRKNHKIGLKKNIFETVILNATDQSIFTPSKDGNKTFLKGDVCNLIAVSWSDNYNKGFDLYHFLDNNLDFSKFRMTFIGRSPISFKNIKHFRALPPELLAKKLQESDIFITGSKNDPCPNSLIEALSCGLPCVAYKGGGHPELLGKAGELFISNREALKKIYLVKENYSNYAKHVKIRNINQASLEYVRFSEKVYKFLKKDQKVSKTLRLYDYLRLLLRNQILKIRLIRTLKRGFYKNISRLNDMIKTLVKKVKSIQFN